MKMFEFREGQMISFTYKNWKGETSKRTVYIEKFAYGSNQWHKEPQFFLIGFDTTRMADRYFAVNDISNIIT
jgi:predicted DNA-binding transcriptional regulator YafY